MSTSGAGPERRQFTPDFLTELFRNPLDPGYADAAARRAETGPRTGWRKQTVSVVSALTLAALGVLLVVAYRQTVAEEPARTRARTELMEQVQRRRTDTDALQLRAESLRRNVAALRDRQLGSPEVARLRDLEAATGLARVRGDGAKVTLSDGPTPINPATGLRDTDGRVKDIDLQLAANGLWAGGAEAISVNGQRLTATSTIRQAGEAILVDVHPVVGPYELVAIGPEDLAEDFSEAYAGQVFRQLAAKYDMSFDVVRVDRVTLEAAAEPQLRFARPSPSPTSPSAPLPSAPLSSRAPSSPPSGTAPPVSAVPSSSPSEGG
jgi:uncharacterized protein YlxW (UPF0749 family)